MSKLINYLSVFVLLLTIVFNLWLYYPETQILADPNDNIFQYSLVGRTNWVWENYGCPLSLSCIPNLIDHNVPNWAEGYPLPFYYSHIPQISIVSSYHLLIQPITKIFNLPARNTSANVAGGQFSLYNYYNWTKYLLLTFFPLSVFLALRIVGFSPILAAFGAFFSAHISTDGLYGIDPPSYLWRGYGLTSQLYGIIFIPLAIAFTYKALQNCVILSGSEESRPNGRSQLAYARDPSATLQDDKLASGRSRKLFLNHKLWAVIFLSLTTAGHLGIGIIGFLSAVPFIFFDLSPRLIWLRFKRLSLILISSLFVLSYWIVPILLNNNYHIVSFWDPIWKFNSYGIYEVVRQFFAGEIFDWQRFPIVTGLVLIGFFAALINKRHPALVYTGISSEISCDAGSHWIAGQAGNDNNAVQHDNLYVFPLLFAFWLLMYFGRTTWGGLIDLIPGMKDFHQHRFVVGIHIAALFLIPAGLEYIFLFIRRGLARIVSARPRLEEYINIIFYILIFIFISFLIYFTVKQTVDYAQLNNKWIYQANEAYLYDEQNFKKILAKIDSLPYGRIYAGRPGNWGKGFRLGSTQLYLLLGSLGYDYSQFLPETWSPMSENEQNFDEREALDYDLLNTKYVLASKNEGFPASVKLVDKSGPFELYKAPTTGWLDIVTSSMYVKSDKTNYINLVHLWWNSYPRRWKMHPLISVENNPVIPDGMQKVLEMKDEVNYQEFNVTAGNVKEGLPNEVSPALSPTKWSDFETKFGTLSRQDPRNIFSDFPFVFPEATVSGKIREEKMEKQTYSATVEMPNNCKSCYVMFKMSYHPDWQVKVDGNDAITNAVFPFYLATSVSPGTHKVEFTYQPNRLKIILLVGEIIAGILFIVRKKIRTLF